MRQKLNENPVAQIVVVAVLLLAGAYLLLSNLSGGSSGGEAEAGAEAAPAAGAEAASGGSAEAEAGTGAATAVGSSPASATSSVSAPAARPLPDAVEAAYADGSTVVLLIYRPGGIDDRLVASAARGLEAMPGVALFDVPARQVARYAAITGPLGVNQAPALVVVRSRRLNHGAAAPATVTYGFQSASDVRQAVRDADYRGPELSYAPN